MSQAINPRPGQRGPGRPATGRTTTVIALRLPNAWAELLKANAAQAGISVNDYALRLLTKPGAITAVSSYSWTDQDFELLEKILELSLTKDWLDWDSDEPDRARNIFMHLTWLKTGHQDNR